VLILNPSRVPLAPLILNISKRPIWIVSFRFHYPSRHGMIRQEEGIRASFETRFANLNFDYNQTKRGRRIAANIAKLPELLLQVIESDSQKRSPDCYCVEA
jgi:hypothetical protein